MISRISLSLALALTLIYTPASPTASVAQDKQRTRVSLINTGADSDADGHAEFRLRKKSRMSFNVEAEDLPAANYDVVIGGVARGVLDVRQLPDGRVEGEIEFDTKREPGHVVMNFDPRGQLVTSSVLERCFFRSCSRAAPLVAAAAPRND